MPIDINKEDIENTRSLVQIFSQKPRALEYILNLADRDNPEKMSNTLGALYNIPIESISPITSLVTKLGKENFVEGILKAGFLEELVLIKTEQAKEILATILKSSFIKKQSIDTIDKTNIEILADKFIFLMKSIAPVGNTTENPLEEMGHILSNIISKQKEILSNNQKIENEGSTVELFTASKKLEEDITQYNTELSILLLGRATTPEMQKASLELIGQIAITVAENYKAAELKQNPDIAKKELARIAQKLTTNSRDPELYQVLNQKISSIEEKLKQKTGLHLEKIEQIKKESISSLELEKGAAEESFLKISNPLESQIFTNQEKINKTQDPDLIQQLNEINESITKQLNDETKKYQEQIISIEDEHRKSLDNKISKEEGQFLTDTYPLTLEIEKTQKLIKDNTLSLEEREDLKSKRSNIELLTSLNPIDSISLYARDKLKLQAEELRDLAEVSKRNISAFLSDSALSNSVIQVQKLQPNKRKDAFLELLPTLIQNQQDALKSALENRQIQNIIKRNEALRSVIFESLNSALNPEQDPLSYTTEKLKSIGINEEQISKLEALEEARRDYIRVKESEYKKRQEVSSDSTIKHDSLKESIEKATPAILEFTLDITRQALGQGDVLKELDKSTVSFIRDGSLGNLSEILDKGINILKDPKCIQSLNKLFESKEIEVLIDEKLNLERNNIQNKIDELTQNLKSLSGKEKQEALTQISQSKKDLKNYAKLNSKYILTYLKKFNTPEKLESLQKMIKKPSIQQALNVFLKTKSFKLAAGSYLAAKDLEKKKNSSKEIKKFLERRSQSYSSSPSNSVIIRDPHNVRSH